MAAEQNRLPILADALCLLIMSLLERRKLVT